MLGSVVQPSGVSAAETLNTRFGTTHIPHPLPVKGMGDKDRDRDSDSSSITRTGVGRQPVPASRIGHHSRFRPDLPTNSPKTMGVEST